MEAARQAIHSCVQHVATRVELTPNDGVINMQVFPGSNAIPAAVEKVDSFPVLVRVAAAATSKQQRRIGVDVVAVLDVSSSMEGTKLDEVKEAMEVAIGKLRDDDRLSIVSFWSQAELVMELTEMNKDGRDAAVEKVNGLKTKSSTNMVAGLNKADEVLSERNEEEKSRLGFIMFLSDGEDKVMSEAKIAKKFPASVKFPAYTFGIGGEHNAEVLKYIADETCGTYSFVNKDTSKITGAIESFVSDLTSIAATSVSITLRAGEGTTITSIEAGGYSKFVHDYVICIPDIYAGEVKNFIVYLTVTAAEDRLLDQIMPCLDRKQLIMTVDGEYEILGKRFLMAGRKVSVMRPRREGGGALGISTRPLVAAELTRIALEKGISDMVDGGANKITGDSLKELWDKIKGSLSGTATPETMPEFDKEVTEMQKRIDGGDADSKSRLAYMLSWLSSNTWQRGTTMDGDVLPREDGGDGDIGSCWPPSKLHLAVVALLFFLAAVIRYYSGGYHGFGLNPEAVAAENATAAIDLSGHPAWPVMEKELQAITRRTEDVQITSYFREASVEDMNLQMDRYLYMAIVHATVLRRRSAGTSISDKSAVRREAESYLRIMLTRMKNVDVPSFQGSSNEFITYEMNRYLYSTIVQANVLRGSYSSDVAIDELSGGRMVTTPGASFIDDSSEATTVLEETLVVKVTELEQSRETLVVQMTELEQSRETLMVRMTEMEVMLRERETLVVSLRSKLQLQAESCAQKAAMAEVQLRTCTQTVDMWKAKVVAMGGRIDQD